MSRLAVTVARVTRSRLALGLLWAVGVLAAGFAGLLGHLDGYERGVKFHGPLCRMPSLPAAYPEETAITLALVATVVIFAAAAALRFRRYLLPLALLQLGVSALLVVVDAGEIAAPVATSACGRILNLSWPVEPFGWAVRGLIAFGPILVVTLLLRRLHALVGTPMGQDAGTAADASAAPRADLLTRVVVPACWVATALAAIAMAVLGRLPGFGRGADLKTRCTAPAIRTSYPHEDLVTAAALASVLILVAAAALRFRRGVLPLAAGQVAVSLGLLWLDFPERLFRVPHVSGPFVCSYLRSTYVTVDIFRASLQVVVVAGPVLLLLVAIMRLRQPRPDPPLPPASVRRRFWDLLR
ncbi:MAG: hypothetical protein HS111_29470 [Kofleriaceae bacterium]|nr:hypothetical protein [Kofleriaceae bacterium]MCL4228296.1 hypothetical protein [Myxococcales bacterium]